MSKNTLSKFNNKRKSCKIVLSFCLAISLIWLSTGLPEDAFASQEILKIRKNIKERLNGINKARFSTMIKRDLKESLAEAKISSKISGDLGFFTKSKVHLPKARILRGIKPMAAQVESERLNVIFELSPDGIDLNKLTSRGIIIKNQYKKLIEVEIPLQNIENIVEEFDEIRYARLPYKFFPLEVMQVISEGVSLSGATAFHDKDYRGEGVKVAIIDVGFKGLPDAQANGNLPDSAIEEDYTGEGLQTQYKHGTGCAEIVHDMAPDAQLYLIKVASEMNFYDAVDYCIDGGIDIISFSLGYFGSGPGDGTGPICEKVDEARQAGILWVSAAGNSANFALGDGAPVGTHWKGVFCDLDGDDVHEFIPGDSESLYNAIVAFPDQDDDDNPETGEVSIVMRWDDDWSGATVDYDMYLFDYDTGDLVASSTATQNGSQPPLESIVIDLPDSEDYLHLYYLIVRVYGELVEKELELSLGGTSLFVPFYKYSSPIATSSSTICEPADAQSTLAVGAIDQANWTAGPQEDFSSQGPTNAWTGSAARVKPDICGPDGVSGYAYGIASFYGTSASAPHVAGAAALLLSAYSNLTVDQLQTMLEDNAIDMGESGKDNLYGSGRLNLPGPQEKGDINNDGEVDIYDVIKCLRFVLEFNEPTPAQRYATDMNNDSEIDIYDVIKILRKVVGLE